ncbi:MAG: tyrosine-type recombinase/integrase [Nitrososphaerota archaeon]
MRSQGYRDTRGCGRSGFLALLKAARHQKRKEKAIRDVAILHLLYCLGLRRGEVVRLQVSDVDLANGRLAVLGKGRTQKEFVSLPEQVSRALSEWLHVRGQDDGPLFHNFDPTSRASGLTGDGLYKIIRYLGRRAGIKTRPHGLRHAAITEALDLTGGNIRAVARFSRHRNLQTLTVYDDNRADLARDIARLVASCASL